MLKMNKVRIALLLALVLCAAVSAYSATVAPAPHTLSANTEVSAIGGSDCSDFANGAAVGLGFAALFGCAACAAGAVIAKGVALFC